MSVAEKKLDPVTRALINARESEEPLTEEEDKAIDEGREYLRTGGKTKPHAEIEKMVAAKPVGVL
jgi:hypothetical protein